MSTAEPDFATAPFKTSSYTDSGGTCVEVAVLPGWAAVRDTKHRDGGHLAVPAVAFAQLITRATRSS